MLAILVLAAITAIALSLSTIILIEIRSSIDLKNTEPNMYSTLGLTEMALFEYKRGSDQYLDVNNCVVGGSSLPWWCSTSNNVKLGVSSQSSYDVPRILVIPASTTVNIPMYFKSNVWENKFSRVVIKPISTYVVGDILIYFNQIPQNTTDINNPVIRGNEITLKSDLEQTGFNSSMQYEIEIKNASTSPKTLAIYSYTQINNIEKTLGLPYIGNKVFNVTANAFNLTRVYQVKIPLP